MFTPLFTPMLFQAECVRYIILGGFSGLAGCWVSNLLACFDKIWKRKNIFEGGGCYEILKKKKSKFSIPPPRFDNFEKK